MVTISQIMYDVEQYSRQGADSIHSNQLEEAIDSFIFAYKRSQQLDDGQTERACAFNLGAAYIAAQQPVKGLEYLEKATPPENKKDGRSNGDLYFNFGLAYESMSNTEEAVRSFTTALEEYKLENDSLTFPKEAETLEKLCKLYVKSNNIFSADAYEKLSYRYQSMREPAKQLDALCKRASMLQKFDRTATEIVEAATKCEALLTSDVCRETSLAGNTYNELGLIYTELQMYNDAQRCFDAALPLVRTANQPSKKQEAIVLQNLGASCNFVGDYQRAIQFHMNAAKCYAQLKNRNSQGQCYANLAFAYSQLGHLDQAKENFNHALLAAKDTDDKRSQWQVLEGLGAVAYNEKNIDEAITHYKEALKAASSGKNASAVQERLVEKLQSCLKVQISGKPNMTRPALRPTRPAITPGVPPSDQIKKETATNTTTAKRDQSKRFIPVNRPGTSREYNKVARGLSTLSAGTLASVPDASETLRPGTILDTGGNTSDTAGSSEEFSSSEDTETEFKKRVMSSSPMKLTSEKNSVIVTRNTEPIQSSDDSSSSSSSSSYEEDDEEEKDKEAVKKEMEQLQSQSSSEESSDEPDTDSDDSQTLGKQKLSEPEPPETKQTLPITKKKSPMEPVSDDDSSSEEEDDDDSEGRSPMEPGSDESSASEEEDDDDSEDNSLMEPVSDESSSIEEAKEKVPELPTSSPVPTSSMAMNTYETAKDSNTRSRKLPRQTSYKDIDFETTKKQGEEKFDQENSQHPNFLSDELVESDVIQQLFHDGEDFTKYEKFTPPLRSHGNSVDNQQSDEDDPKEFEISGEHEEDDYDDDDEDDEDDSDEEMHDPVYQSIHPRDMADIPSFEKTEGSSSFADLPRGEQEDKPNSRRSSSSSVNSKGERYLHEKHQEIIQKRQENQTEEKVKKKSEVCIVM